MQSLWNKTTEIYDRPTLPGDIETTAVVIGAGLAGVLTAYYLQERGMKTVVIEAESIGSGATAGTTAKITSQHGAIYHKLIESFDENMAKQYYGANQRAIDQFAELIDQLNIDCDFERLPACIYSNVQRDIIEKEARAVQQLGIPARFAEKAELPFETNAALYFDDQAQFHPLKFIKAVADKLTIFEHTRALEVNKNCVVTDKGTITAEHIILTCHFPFINSPGYYFMRMHQERSYVIALKNAMKVDAMYYGVDDKVGLSLRNAEGQLLLGGYSHRTGENERGGNYKRLRERAHEIWPGCETTEQWSNQDCMTLDKIPYIGRFSSSIENLYVATGFNKWGMSSAMAAAMLLSDLVATGTGSYIETFSPQRFIFSASAKQLFEDGIKSSKGLMKSALIIPATKVESLPKGHGGIVDVDGQKAGVYKDKDGRIYAVLPKCKHLGCQLEWNPDEKSWDCPCHGSRYDYEGNLISGPAQEGLDKLDVAK